MAKRHSKAKSLRATSPHKSFRRSYREDYRRELKVPGMAEHVISSLMMLCKNWRIFGPFLFVMTAVSALTMGINWNLNEVTIVFGALIFLVIWLTTIFILRQLMAGHKVSLRDGLYNAMTPLITTLIVLLVVATQCVPIIIVIVAYSAAMQTEFLTTPFYVMLFLGFAALLITVAGYLLSSSLMALVAVTAPGLYPLKALKIAADLMMGRRVRFLLRLVMLGVMLTAFWLVGTMPLALLKAWWGDAAVGNAVIAILTTVMVCFSAMYVTAYLYIYYRYMLDAEE